MRLSWSRRQISGGSFDLNSTTIWFDGLISPLTQDVTLQIGSFSVTIPARSFFQDNKGAYVFQGTINDVSLQVKLDEQANGSYTLQVQGSGADLSGITNPVTVTVVVGTVSGGTSAIASTN